MEKQVHTGKIKPRLPPLQMDSLPVEPQGKPKNPERVAYPFSRGSSQPRNQTGASCTAGGFLTSWATRGAFIKRNHKKHGKISTHWEDKFEICIKINDLKNDIRFISKILIPKNQQ